MDKKAWKIDRSTNPMKSTILKSPKASEVSEQKYYLNSSKSMAQPLELWMDMTVINTC